MRYRYAKYGYYIPGSEFTIETYCPSCQSTSVMTVLGDGALQLQCDRCNYNARHESYKSLRRCFRVRERIAKRDLNEYCERRFDAAFIAFQIYTRDLARALSVPAHPNAVQRAFVSITDDIKRTQFQTDAEMHAWNDYQRNYSWHTKPDSLVRYYFAQLRNHYGY